jgi:hypothetical protein
MMLIDKVMLIVSQIQITPTQCASGAHLQITNVCIPAIILVIRPTVAQDCLMTLRLLTRFVILEQLLNAVMVLTMMMIQG